MNELLPDPIGQSIKISSFDIVGSRLPIYGALGLQNTTFTVQRDAFTPVFSANPATGTVTVYQGTINGTIHTPSFYTTDPLIRIANDNYLLGDTVDFGIYGQYADTPGAQKKYSGLIRKAGGAGWTLFKDYTNDPDTSPITSYTLDSLTITALTGSSLISSNIIIQGTSTSANTTLVAPVALSETLAPTNPAGTMAEVSSAKIAPVFNITSNTARTITKASGGLLELKGTIGSNVTITDLYNLIIKFGTLTNSGTITNAYGVYCEAPTISGTAAGSSYALWSNGYSRITGNLNMANSNIYNINKLGVRDASSAASITPIIPINSANRAVLSLKGNDLSAQQPSIELVVSSNPVWMVNNTSASGNDWEFLWNAYYNGSIRYSDSVNRPIRWRVAAGIWRILNDNPGTAGNVISFTNREVFQIDGINKTWGIGRSTNVPRKTGSRGMISLAGPLRNPDQPGIEFVLQGSSNPAMTLTAGDSPNCYILFDCYQSFISADSNIVYSTTGSNPAFIKRNSTDLTFSIASSGTAGNVLGSSLTSIVVSNTGSSPLTGIPALIFTSSLNNYATFNASGGSYGSITGAITTTTSAVYTRIDNFIVVRITGFTGTSTGLTNFINLNNNLGVVSTTFVPSVITYKPIQVIDNGTPRAGVAIINTSGIIELRNLSNSGGFQNYTLGTTVGFNTLVLSYRA